MKLGVAAELLTQFSVNWAARKPELRLRIKDGALVDHGGHALLGEVESLCAGRSGSLPFFDGSDTVHWCTVAPTQDDLRRAIADLQAWILPSFGWVSGTGGITSADGTQGPLASELMRLSPAGYFRWNCSVRQLDQVIGRLALRRRLDAARPSRLRPIRPSLYELRARFSTCLLVGDRDGALEALESLDQHQLDSAANIQFMRIRLWSHFREFERITRHPDLHRLQSQILPDSIARAIDEAIQASAAPASVPTPPAEPPAPTELGDWPDWLAGLNSSSDASARNFLEQRIRRGPDGLSSSDVHKLSEALDQLFLSDEVLRSRRGLVCEGLAELLQEFIREPDFPRSAFRRLYVSVLRLWSALHSGTSAGGEEGHVLLELASAALRLNHEPNEVLEIIKSWWHARKVPAQLPFLLDAIELLDLEHPNRTASAGLWVDAADLIRRDPDALTPSEKTLWRLIGQRLDFGKDVVAEYLPEDKSVVVEDPLSRASVRSVAIVCMRERQATEAARAIAGRSGADVFVVTNKSGGADTKRALTADVVLFVWMATTHAVFREFDGFDRNRFCYVQGTGSASIERALERWLHERGG